MSEPVDVLIAEMWNKTWPHAGRMSPEMTGSLCQVFQNAGLLEIDRREVGVTKVGPFRLAVRTEKAALARAFLEGGLPTIIRVMCEGLTPADAVVEVLVNSFVVGAAVAQSSVLIEDPLAWCVLVYVKSRNRAGLLPEVGEIMAAVTHALPANEEPQAAINRIINSLQHSTPIVGDSQVRLIEHRGNGYQVLV